MADLGERMDERIDERLRAAGAAFQAQQVPDAAVRWPNAKRRRSRGWLAPVAAAVAVAVVVAAVAFGINASRDSGSTPQPPATPSPATSSLLPDKDYAAGTPFDAGVSGPAPASNPPCKPAALRLSATTTQAVDGVLGLIDITGDHCKLTVDPKTITLIEGSGKPVGVARSAGNPQNPASAIRPDLALASGSVHVGFAWTGSYCGPAPTAVRITILGRPRDVPLSGPTPPCRKGAGGVVVPGVVAGLDVPVEPAPLSWQDLRVRLDVPSSMKMSDLRFTVVMTNAGKEAVSLAAPCPGYRVSFSAGALPLGGSSVWQESGDLCARPLTVPAGGSLRIPIQVARSDLGEPGPEGVMDVGWEMAGIAEPGTVSTVVVQ